MSQNWFDKTFFPIDWDWHGCSRHIKMEQFAERVVLNARYNRKWNNEKVTVCDCRSFCFQAQRKQTKPKNLTWVKPVRKDFQIQKTNKWGFEPLHFKIFLSQMVNFLKIWGLTLFIFVILGSWKHLIQGRPTKAWLVHLGSQVINIRNVSSGSGLLWIMSTQLVNGAFFPTCSFIFEKVVI